MDKKQSKETYGRFDDKGHWRPSYACQYSPLFSVKFDFRKLLKYIFGWGGYLFPRNVFYFLLSLGTYFLFKNDFNNFDGITIEFIGLSLLRNLVLVFFFFGGYYLLLYKFKIEGKNKKYHPDWTQKDSKKFYFNNQVKDNMLRAIVVGVPVWTAYEVLYMWLNSKGMIPTTTFVQNPVWFVGLFLLIPLIREIHFYIAHKILHMGWMMRNVHNVHHMNPNPNPWSGLAMHPIEMILYFSVGLVNFVLASHPVHFLYNMQLTALTPAQGHSGFEGPLLKGWLPVGDYFHYLHHKYVACNFGAASIPLDKWFGIYYDGEGEFKYQKVKFVDIKGTKNAKK